MIVYILKEKITGFTIHKIKTNVQIFDGMYMYIGQTVYIIRGDVKSHIFKEYDTNVYEVTVVKVSDELEKGYNIDIVEDIKDIIREVKIDDIMN